MPNKVNKPASEDEIAEAVIRWHGLRAREATRKDDMKTYQRHEDIANEINTRYGLGGYISFLEDN